MAAFEKEFKDFVTTTFRHFGIDSLGAKLIAELYLEPSELSLEMLAKRTGYSLASVSSKLKQFESLGQVQRTKKPGSKKIYYSIHSDLGMIMRAKMDAFHHLYFEPAQTIIPDIISRAKEAKLTELEKKKLQIIIDYHTKVKQVERLMAEMRRKLEKV